MALCPTPPFALLVWGVGEMGPEGFPQPTREGEQMKINRSASLAGYGLGFPLSCVSLVQEDGQVQFSLFSSYCHKSNKHRSICHMFVPACVWVCEREKI